MTATGAPASVPRCSSPAWLSTVETGKCGISRYGTVAWRASASAKSPSPVPRMIPTRGRTRVFESTCWAAASMRVMSSLATAFLLLQQRVERGLRAPGLDAFDRKLLQARPGSARHAHLPSRDLERDRDQVAHRAVRAPVLRRRRDLQLQRPVLEPRADRVAARAGMHAHSKLLRHPIRSATSRSVCTTNMRMNQIASIATNGVKSMPEYCSGNSRRSGLHTRSDTRSRNITIGLFGSGRTHDNSAFTKITIISTYSSVSSTDAIALSRFP